MKISSLALRSSIYVFVDMLLFLFNGTSVLAQAGSFQIPLIGNPVNDLTTGVTRCTINWVNLQLTQVKGINLSVSVSGTAVCVNNALVPNPTVINAGFVNPMEYSNAFTNTGLTIS